VFASNRIKLGAYRLKVVTDKNELFKTKDDGECCCSTPKVTVVSGKLRRPIVSNLFKDIETLN